MTWLVSDVMTKDPIAIGPETRFKACAKLMQVHELTAVPVTADGGILVGIVSEADLLAKEAERSVRGRDGRLSRKATAMTVADLMTRDLVTTTAAAPLTIAASLMFEHHLKVLPVVESTNRLVGTISRAQVLNVFLRSDESIRREVARELRLVPEIIRGNVEAEVNDGMVRLRGDVDGEGIVEILSRMVAGIPGVVGVVSELKIAAALNAGSRAVNA